MLKKMALGIVLAAVMVTTVSAKQHVIGGKNGGKQYVYTLKADQSSQEAILMTICRAAFLDDIDVIWSILTPESIKQMEKEAGSTAKAKDIFRKQMNSALGPMLTAFGNEIDAKVALIGMLDNDPDMMWNAFSLKARQTLITKAGSEENVKKQLKMQMQIARPQMIKQMNATYKPSQFQKINGKWYFSPNAK